MSNKFKVSQQQKTSLLTGKAQINYDEEHPIFCLKNIDPKRCITNCETNDKAQFVDTIRTLSTMDWKTIRHAPRKGLGSETIAQNSLRCKIPPLPPNAKIIAFKYSDQKAMVGYRTRDILHIIGVEKNCGDIYDH